MLRFTFVLLMSMASWVYANPINLDEDGRALQGYDVVSYFDNEPVVGKAEYTMDYEGASYWFVSKEHLELFKKEPEHFIPAYGGYCAYGVRMGKKFNISPEEYELVDDKLYLMLDRSTKLMWKKDMQRSITIAETLWPKIAPVSAKVLSGESK